MSFYKEILINETTSIYVWKIEEDFNTLFREVKLKDSSLARLESMKSESHQKGFLAVRMLLQYIGYSDFDLFYDAFGKPNLKNEERSTMYEVISGKMEGIMNDKDLDIQHPTSNIQHVSISHSFDFSCICISTSKIVGIDVEVLKT
ncbi:MAG: hypothetical protein HC854_07400 [Flavobacterium sp.]|nr:hypothetical protein [Flavobacterium sp.]